MNRRGRDQSREGWESQEKREGRLVEVARNRERGNRRAGKMICKGRKRGRATGLVFDIGNYFEKRTKKGKTAK